MKISSVLDELPDRPAYLHELSELTDEYEEVLNARGIFYESDNINGVICIFINISGQGHILGFDNEDEEWIELTSVSDDEQSTGAFTEEADNIIAWIEIKYGEDGYGIYGMYGDDLKSKSE